MVSDVRERLTRRDILLFIFGGIGFLIFAAFYGRLSPASAVRMEVNGKRAAEITQTFLEQQGINVEDYQKNVSLVSDGEQIMYLQKSLGQPRANRLIRERIPAYYWEIAWSQRKGSSTATGEEGTETPEEIQAKVDGQGTIFAFDFSIAQEDTARTRLLNEEEALALAEEYVSRHMNADLSGYERRKEAQVSHKGGSDWDFLWERRDIGIANERIEIGVAVQGARVVTYDFSYRVPETMEALYKKETDTPVPYIVFLVIVWVGVGLTFLVLFFIKAIRSELEFKYGLILGATLAAVYILAMFLSLFLEEWREGVEYFLKAIFVVIGAILLWSVCDSLVRSTWREKLAIFDVLGHRKLLTVEFGLAIFRGYAFAFIGLGLVTLFTVVGARASLLWLQNEGIPSLYASTFPFLFIVVNALIVAVFVELIFRLFTVSFLRGRTRSTLMVLLLSALILGFSGLNFFKLAPTWCGTMAGCGVAFLFCYAFLRYELVTVITGSFVILSLWKAWPLLFTGDASHFANGLASLAVISVPFFLSYISLQRGESVARMVEYIPPYMARALEQERMKQELDIARQVQLSFLPPCCPPIQNLDIAALCVPANEVGGDYYDFVPLGPNRVGIAIGDVSGKGVSAAFYMALTKGFLRSEAADHDSPKEILSEVNARFYENSEPNVFISMVYGVFDTESKRFTYARAGHNPVILRRTTEGKPQLFAPPGIALGLDRGKIFDRVITEDIIDLNPGDILIFYTDGFTEAINWRKDEFGEERLLDLIERNKENDAWSIVTSIEREIQAFIEKTPQRDDMTMVVVKVG